MRIRILLMLASLALLSLPLAGAPSVSGVAQYRFDSGKGSNGKTWISVSCYIGGVFLWADGMDCNGNKYFRRTDPRTLRQVPDDPTAGLAPTHTGETDAGAWRSVIVRDPVGVPVGVMGVGASGAYYTYECVAAPEAGYR